MLESAPFNDAPSLGETGCKLLESRPVIEVFHVVVNVVGSPMDRFEDKVDTGKLHEDLDDALDCDLIITGIL
jgi:hypothetical protein